MSFFKNAYQKLRDNVFGVASAPDPTPDDGLDIGPAKLWYVKRLFPHSVLTKKLTPSRAKEIREVFRRLRPEQREIALLRGWNRGLNV
jgi:hypothetical protein